MSLGLTDRGRATAAAGTTLAAAGALLGFADLTRVGLLAVVVVALAAALVALTRPRVDVETDVDATALTVGQAGKLPCGSSPFAAPPTSASSNRSPRRSEAARRAHWSPR
ncbi:hypothetical protein [Mobilicoccus caccae]|uniref:Uncharacterized protein n=1 Tax=Mobilicoccus caccae TaxID=1859295 RepID=A0ABQ6ITK6_9MICO|nr:hypothetical protein [Mobilicoccus caccae]GMA40057.1 hypothetical protein GCM10025883_21020 [Mobilicoccus caccae]